MPTPFPILDVTDWPAAGEEAMGSKRKVWLEAADRAKWLFKQQHRAYTGDDWSEKVAAEVADLLGVPHATVQLATRRGVRGCIGRDLVGQLGAAELVPGNRLLVEHDPTYPKDDRYYRVSDHTLDRVLAAIGQGFIGVPAGTPDDPAVRCARDVFVGYLLLDALIGNTDRHPENWAVLLFRPVGPERAGVLCPTFDHAACLGFNLADGERAGRLSTRDRGYAVSAYVLKARSALYRSEADKKPLSPLDTFRAAAGWCPDAARYWLGRLTRIGDEQLTDIVNRVPDVMMTGTARRFASAVLSCNRTNLLADGDQ